MTTGKTPHRLTEGRRPRPRSDASVAHPHRPRPQTTQTTQTTPAPAAGGRLRSLADRAAGLLTRFLTLRDGSIILITLITMIYFAVTVSGFFTAGNFKALLPYFAPYAIMAAAEVFVMILGEIDLSIGAMYLFTPFWWHIINSAGVPLIPSMILALMTAMALGALNGFAVAYIGIASFVATLGMQFFLYGLTLVISHATPVLTPGTSQAHVNTFAHVFGGGTYSELFWALGIVVILQITLVLTRWGGYTIATGGAGTVVGALIGALFLGVLRDGLIIKGVSANYLYLYLGIAVIIAMTANVFVSRIRRRAGHE